MVKPLCGCVLELGCVLKPVCGCVLELGCVLKPVCGCVLELGCGGISSVGHRQHRRDSCSRRSGRRPESPAGRHSAVSVH